MDKVTMIVKTGVLGWRVGESGKTNRLMAVEFWFEVVEHSRDGEQWQPYNRGNVLSANELYT